jgi:hypothetical protein
MKYSDLKAGDLVRTDDGFACMEKGVHTVFEDAEGCLYLRCSKGYHYLGDPVDETETGHLIGIRPV